MLDEIPHFIQDDPRGVCVTGPDTKANPTQGTQIEFQPGTIIFKEGDPGGDLYFIKKGEVEVYRESKGLHVPLALLKEGEILGVMTCLTRDPRLASARAKTLVKAMIVRQAGFKRLIATMPTWVNTVIKDFVLRIRGMDELYTRAMTRLDRQERELSMLSLAGQLASGLYELGDVMTPGRGEDRLVEIDLVMRRLERVLGAQDGDLERVFQVFAEVGLLKVDPKATERRAELAVLARLASVASFAKDLLASQTMRRTYESFTPQETAALAALADRHRALGKTAAAEITVELALIPPEKADPAALKSAVVKAASVGILDRQSGDVGVSLVSTRLTQALRHLSVLHKLRNIDRSSPPEALPAAGAKPAVAPATDEDSVVIITENY